jgi:hypothetical protein
LIFSSIYGNLAKLFWGKKGLKMSLMHTFPMKKTSQSSTTKQENLDMSAFLKLDHELQEEAENWLRRYGSEEQKGYFNIYIRDYREDQERERKLTPLRRNMNEHPDKHGERPKKSSCAIV